MFDNRQLSINGKSKEALLAALKMAFIQSEQKTARAWIKNQQQGIILLWADTEALENNIINKFLEPVTPEEVLPMIERYLLGDEAKKVHLKKWDEDADHDGSNDSGWRVYVEDWGHIGEVRWSGICAIKRTFLWYGK